jgi:hypothetical protein
VQRIDLGCFPPLGVSRAFHQETAPMTRTNQLVSQAGKRYQRRAKVPLTIRIPEQLRQELTYSALEHGVSLNAEILQRLSIGPILAELRLPRRDPQAALKIILWK